MRHSRLWLRFFGLAATVAFLHAQAMACCWNMQGPVSIAPENSDMAADHACCHKVTEAFSGPSMAAPGMDCGYQAIGEAALTSTHAPDPAAINGTSFPIPISPEINLRANRDRVEVITGLPLYLVTLRLLI